MKNEVWSFEIEFRVQAENLQDAIEKAKKINVADIMDIGLMRAKRMQVMEVDE